MKNLYIFCIPLLAIILSSCGSSNKFASSFGKRRYTKGYYVDVPASIQASLTNKAEANQAVHAPNSEVLNTINKTEQVTKPQPTVAAVTKENNTKAGKHILQNFARFVLPKIPAKPTLASTGGDAAKGNGFKNSGETNYIAILGFVVSLVGDILAIIAQNFTLASIIVLAIGTGLCIYSLFVNKIYLTWLAVIGISLTIFLLVLIVL